MNFEQLFRLFYTKYRGEENPPTTTDPEWEIAVSNYNNALDRLEEYDDARWDFLKTTLQVSTQVSPVLDRTLTTGDLTFTCPTDMLFPGGLYWKIDLNGVRSVPMKVKKVEDIAVTSQFSQYSYFIGDQHNGYTFNLNPAVPVEEDGWGLDYIYYKKAPRLIADSSDPNYEDGTSIITGAPAKFFACYMAAQRFLDSRNFPAYQVMLRDAEESLKNSKLRNNSGDYYNNLGIQDIGPGFGY
jgi:hypothetical protein